MSSLYGAGNQFPKDFKIEASQFDKFIIVVKSDMNDGKLTPIKLYSDKFCTSKVIKQPIQCIHGDEYRSCVTSDAGKIYFKEPLDMVTLLKIL